MSGTQKEEESQQFEQVLTRLDALLRRKYANRPDVPAASEPPTFVVLPPSPSESKEDPVPELSRNTNGQEPNSPSPTESFIPVLTDIYEGTLPSGPPSSPTSYADATEAIIEALLPMMLDIVERAVREESLNMQQTITSRLRTEMALALRERLLAED